MISSMMVARSSVDEDDPEQVALHERLNDLRKRGDELDGAQTMSKSFQESIEQMDEDAVGLLSWGCRTRLGADIMMVLNCLLAPDPCSERVLDSDGLVLQPTHETDPIECTTVGEDTMLAETCMTYKVVALRTLQTWYVEAHLVVTVMDESEAQDLGVFSFTRVRRREASEQFTFNKPIEEQITAVTSNNAARFCKAKNVDNTLGALCTFVAQGGDVSDTLLKYCNKPISVTDEITAAVEEFKHQGAPSEATLLANSAKSRQSIRDILV